VNTLMDLSNKLRRVREYVYLYVYSCRYLEFVKRVREREGHALRIH